MKFAMKSIVASTAFVAAGLASAADIIIGAGSVDSNGYTFSDLVGSGTLEFSSDLVGAVDTGKIKVEAVAPATVELDTETTDVGNYGLVKATAPVTTLKGGFDGTTLSVNNVLTAGGALQTVIVPKKPFASTGGNLAITNLRVDLPGKHIYADLLGANGVGQHNDVLLWNFADITGSPTSFAVKSGANVATNTITGLSIDSGAFDLFSKSLGLTPNGIAALQGVADYGKITSTISVTATAITPSVPEASASAYALLGLGLMGVFAARRRAK